MTAQMANQISNHSNLTKKIILGMLLGIAAGMLFGKSISSIGILGTLLIQLIKAVAVPLVFFAIFEALFSTDISWRHARRLLAVIAINSTIALAIGILLCSTFSPGEKLSWKVDSPDSDTSMITKFADKKIEPLKLLAGYLPQNLLTPLIEGNVIGVVLIALILGCAARKIRYQENFHRTSQRIEESTSFILKIFEVTLTWLICLVPLAVFAVTAKTVGEHGFAPFAGLAKYVAVSLSGMLLQILIVYQLWIGIFSKISLRQFWSAAKTPVVYALGTNSSLATLPITLKELDNLGVSKSASRLGSGVGTNLNNDGIILYEAVAVLFVAQAYGIDLSLGQQVSVMLLCLIAAIGVAGIPEAGIISLSLVLSTAQLPLEILPLLLTVDWVIARARSATNVLSDMTVSIAVDSFKN
jgi:DAACS family dicarboxylate/amino acid:cation (Na+ or H+) symporter